MEAPVNTDISLFPYKYSILVRIWFISLIKQNSEKTAASSDANV